MLVVHDVAAASSWFQQALGLTSGHGGDEYEMLMSGSDVVVQLHHWDADEHPHLGDPDDDSRGNGVVLWFGTDEFDAIVASVEASGSTVLEGPFANPLSKLREVWVRGPDGYVVVVAGA